MNKIMLFAVCLAGSVLSANAQSLSVSHNAIKVTRGEKSTFTVILPTSAAASALQTNMSNVEGITVSGAVSLTNDSVKYSTTSNVANTSVVVAYNFNNPTTEPSQTAFKADSLFTVEVTTSDTFKSGEMTITPVASGVGATTITLSPITVKVNRNGDSNDDGAVDGQDFLSVRSNYLANGVGYFNYIEDFNEDGVTDGQDALAIRSAYLATGGAKEGQVDLGE